MNCNACGAELPVDAVFCQKCGAKAGSAAPAVVEAPDAGLRAPTPGSRRDDTEEELWQGGYSAKAMIGWFALAVVVTIAGWFLLKAAVEFDPRDAVGLGGALARVAGAAYGKWLLGAVALGLLVFAAFDVLQARYHRA